jgi:hypothetical protein
MPNGRLTPLMRLSLATVISWAVWCPTVPARGGTPSEVAWDGFCDRLSSICLFQAASRPSGSCFGTGR